MIRGSALVEVKVLKKITPNKSNLLALSQKIPTYEPR
jgi:hypothetical protein